MRVKRDVPILCGECTLIYPNPKQRKPCEGERCEVCGKEGRS